VVFNICNLSSHFPLYFCLFIISSYSFCSSSSVLSVFLFLFPSFSGYSCCCFSFSVFQVVPYLLTFHYAFPPFVLMFYFPSYHFLLAVLSVVHSPPILVFVDFPLVLLYRSLCVSLLSLLFPLQFYIYSHFQDFAMVHLVYVCLSFCFYVSYPVFAGFVYHDVV